MLPDLSVPTRSFRRTIPSLAIVLLLVTLLGCGGEESFGDDEHPPPDRTVDVPPLLEVPIDDDPREAPRRVELVGVLPSDFPPDLPIHLPSSVVDFGPGTVELLSGSSPAQVRASLRSRLETAGWGVAGDGSSYRLSKNGRSVTLSIRGGQGTTYRYEY